MMSDSCKQKNKPVRVREREEQIRHFQGQIAERANWIEETSAIIKHNERIVIKSQQLRKKLWIDCALKFVVSQALVCDPIYLIFT